MNPSAADQPESENIEPLSSAAETAPTTANEAVHPDPITGEPGAHPVGVSIGALGAGAAGAAIGALAGPVGLVIGAAIGAVAGGLAGKEVATAAEEPTTALGDESGAGGAVPVFSSAFTAPTTADAPESGALSSSGLAAPFTATEVPVSRSDDDTGFSAQDGGFSAQSIPEAGTIAPATSSSDFTVGDVDVDAEASVRTAAYYRYLERQQSGGGGDEVSDWLEAEKPAPKI